MSGLGVSGTVEKQQLSGGRGQEEEGEDKRGTEEADNDTLSD